MRKPFISPILLVLSLSFQPLALSPAWAAGSDLISEPTSIHRLYSDIDMQLRLATKKNMPDCVAAQCQTDQVFNHRINRIGQQLAGVAYDLYPNLVKRVAIFQFSVVNKAVEGATSNAEGDIVIFRGLQHLALNDEALSFIIAREMGHVMGKHHTKNTSTKLLISAIASVVFPVAGLITASSTAAQASTISTAVTSAASTATSLIGSEVVMTNVKPTQLVESDAYANSLLESQGIDYQQVLNGLPMAKPNQTEWVNGLQKSKSKIEARLKLQQLIAELSTNPAH